MFMKSFNPIPIEEIRAAQKRIADSIVRTPLVSLNVDDAPAEIYLKLENLQPPGAFKLRGALNAVALADEKQLEEGVWTISTGNMAKALAWCAQQQGLKCTVIVREGAADTKVRAIKSFGADVIIAPYKTRSERDYLTRAFLTGSYEGVEGFYINGSIGRAVMAGNGTIGVEILEGLPDVDAVLIPWGVGGFCCGIASAIRTLKSDVKLYACEVETAAPFATSNMIGEPAEEIDYSPSFVDGIGFPVILPEMWDLAEKLKVGSLVVGLEETVDAIRLLAEQNHVIAEGASAVPVAAALSGRAGTGKIASVVSGGNIDTAKLIKILHDEVP